MKIVIAGAGEVGCHLAKMLQHEKHDLTLIDDVEERLEMISEDADIVSVFGNPTTISALNEAKVDKADLFVAVYPAKNQDINIVAALLAKQLGAKKVTARINNSEYLLHENKLMFKELGIDLLFYPEGIAATEIAGLLKQTEITEFVDFARGRLQLVVMRLDSGAPMIDVTEESFGFSGSEIPFKVLAVARKGETFIPTVDTKFRLGDLVYIVCRKETVDMVLEYTGKTDFRIETLTILGGGRIGEMVAERFEKDVRSVKLIELNRDRCDYLSKKLNKTLIINGDGRNSDLFFEADVKNSDAFVAVTSSSETNIMASVAVKKMGVPKVIAEVENLEYIRLAEGMGIDAIINKKLITAGRIFRFTMSNKVRTIKTMSTSNAEVLEMIANPESMVTKAPIGDLSFPEDAKIGGIIRGSECFIATADFTIKPYDRVAVFALPTALKKIDKFFV
ncbi:MAG: Trk system potassium transporter TrkA [Bacteroidales bacterium]|nr:Trk system potassium transporter TrkA [Bacteroidales bacterium]